jgi:hypothetical protein
MYIPPWLLALLVLVVVCAMGVTIRNSFHGLPENFVSEQAPAKQQQEKEQSVATIQQPPADPVYDGQDTEFNDYLRQIKSRVGNSSIIPTQQNLDLISGGKNPPPEESLVQQYMSNQEKIQPHEMPPQRSPAIIANVPTDAGTEAEKIQRESTATRSIRENVRGDGSTNQGFMNQHSITYVHA